MTEEQLAVLFASSEKRELPFWLSRPGRGAIAILVFAVLWYLTSR